MATAAEEAASISIDADSSVSKRTSGSASPVKVPEEKKGGGRTSNGGTSFASKESGPPNLHPTVTTWQWLFAASDMQYTPSVLHSGASPEQERFWRWKGAQLIFRIGDYMRLGNHVMTTAAIFFHRFYMRRSLPKEHSRERPFDTFNFQEMAPTCIFLACKVEETHRKLHGVVEATLAVMDRSPAGLDAAEARTYKADVKAKDYRRWKDVVLLFEERLLETLCFDLIIEQPHPIAIKACKRLATSRDLAQLTIILLNTMLYGAVCTFHDAATLAAAAFKTACQLVGIDPATYTALLGSTRTWYDAFDVDFDEVNDALPDIEDQLSFHNEHITVPQQSHSALKTHNSTPNFHQHTSFLALQSNGNSEVVTPNSASEFLSSKQPQNPPENSHIEKKVKTTDDRHFEYQEPGMEDKRRVEGSRDDSIAEREKRTEPAWKPIGHGSVDVKKRPPPPLALEDAGLAARSSPDDPHEEAAAAKVLREQITQEEGERITAVKADEEAAEEGEVTSEEEGAL
ncbi:hypothetical protein CBS101457_006397 [Exobasidium rhododendri]|nr:hypothetical protein CBS101457_006397 [Exobasidium rhododendri]